MTDWVYFIFDKDASAIKIGHSVNVKFRLSQLQGGSSNYLKLLALEAGGASREKELHERFASHHLRREWFKNNDEIQNYVCNLLVVPGHPDYESVVASKVSERKPRGVKLASSNSSGRERIRSADFYTTRQFAKEFNYNLSYVRQMVKGLPDFRTGRPLHLPDGFRAEKIGRDWHIYKLAS